MTGYSGSNAPAQRRGGRSALTRSEQAARDAASVKHDLPSEPAVIARALGLAKGYVRGVCRALPPAPALGRKRLRWYPSQVLAAIRGQQAAREVQP